MREKRGRPDVVHIVLLEALGSLINMEGLLEVKIHTLGDYVIDVDPSARIPRNYMLFVGLMEQLFEVGRVPPDSPKPLLTLRPLTLERLIEGLPRPVIAISNYGDYMKLSDLAAKLVEKKLRATIVFPGFPAAADFSSKVYRVADLVVKPSRKHRLDPWTIVSHTLALLAHRLGLA